MCASPAVLRRDTVAICFFGSLSFVGFWSSILYHNIYTIGTDTVALLLDTFVTVFIVCIGAAALTGILVRRTFRGKELPAIRKDERFWNLFPRRPCLFGFVMAVYTSILLTVLFDGTYGVFDWTQLTLTEFVMVKMLYSGILGALAAIAAIQRILPAESKVQ